MKRITLLAAVLLIALVNVAIADKMPGEATHHRGGAGFHNSDAPIGMRWWLSSEKVGIDVGFGYSSSPAPSDAEEKLKDWAVDFGVPFLIHSWDRVHVLLRP